MIPATGLLRLLSNTAAPSQTQHTAQANPSGPAFAALLEKARAGEVPSGLEVKVRDDAGITLTQDQLQRLALAADRAEAQGATRALVLIDGKALRLDVTMREITGAVNLKHPAVLTGIDAVITTPPAPPTAPTPDTLAPGDESKPSILPLPSGPAAFSNASLLKSLAAQDK